MRSIKIVGLAVVAVLALSSLAASSAFAEEFEANKEGTLAGKAKTTQKFKTGSGATVECTKLTTPESSVKELKTTKQAINVKYESCKVLIFGEATISTAHYTFFTMSASEGLGVSILVEPIIIKAGGFGEECEIEVKSGQKVGTTGTEIVYGNGTSSTGKESITLNSKVTKIKSKILKSSGPNSGSNCGTQGAEVETGAYEGEAEVELTGTGNELKV